MVAFNNNQIIINPAIHHCSKGYLILVLILVIIILSNTQVNIHMFKIVYQETIKVVLSIFQKVFLFASSKKFFFFFISFSKLFSFSRYLSFCCDFLVMQKNSLIRKIRLILKFMTSKPG